MATDPVCYAILDEENTEYTCSYRDTEFYFCCNWCKKQFEENPKRYYRLARDASDLLNPR
ncbi:MAG: YHS domain-containing protein [Methanoregulaceae archaeon]|jgi:YHS domain-containing protein|nr:YHS domain-containing protein [Methanoregulaceae archaeon]